MSLLVQVEFQFQGIVGAGRVSISSGEDASSYTKGIAEVYAYLLLCITIIVWECGYGYFLKCFSF